MAAIWPTRLPRPVRNGYSEALPTRMREFKMASGRYRRQNRFQAQSRPFSITWHFTFAEFEYFEAFVQYDVVDKDGYVLLKIYPSDIAPKELRMVAQDDGSMYSTVFDEGLNKWAVSAQFERKPVVANFPAKTGTFPLWPSDLPQLPEKVNYALQTNMMMFKDNFDEGYFAQVQRSKLRVTTIPVTFYMDESQRVIFDEFITNTLNNCIFPFKMKLVNGSGERDCICSFAEPLPSIKPVGGWYEVNGTIRTESLTILSEQEYRSK